MKQLKQAQKKFWGFNGIQTHDHALLTELCAGSRSRVSSMYTHYMKCDMCIWYTIPCKKSWDTVLIKEFFSVSDIFVFFYPSSPFQCCSVATKSIGQSNMLNIEKGEGESIGCKAISLKMREKAQITANFWWVSQPLCMGLQIVYTVCTADIPSRIVKMSLQLWHW